MSGAGALQASEATVGENYGVDVADGLESLSICRRATVRVSTNSLKSSWKNDMCRKSCCTT